jgi:uncharacterized protein
MATQSKIKQLFWNQDEKRLRAFWRLSIHTILLFIFTAVFTTGLMFFAVLFNLTSGISAQNLITEANGTPVLEASWITMVFAPLATSLAVFSATALTGRLVDRRRFRDFGINLSPGWWVDLIFGLGLGALLMTLIFLVGWLTGSIRVTGFFQVQNQDMSFISGISMALIFFIFVGIYEELLSRGYHLINLAEGFNHQSIGGRWALLSAYGVSSLIFAILHLGNPNATLVSVINIFLAGLFLGLGMVLTGSLAIPIGLHITWNFFQGNVFGYAVSGIQTGVTIVATEPVKNPWLMGNAFGPESGLISVIAMAFGVWLTVLWVRKRGRLALHEDLAVYSAPIREAELPPQAG